MCVWPYQLLRCVAPPWHTLNQKAKTKANAEANASAQRSPDAEEHVYTAVRAGAKYHTGGSIIKRVGMDLSLAEIAAELAGVHDAKREWLDFMCRAAAAMRSIRS